MEALLWLIKRVYFILTHQVYGVRGLKDFLGVSEYISKNKIIIQFGLLKRRADLSLVSI